MIGFKDYTLRDAEWEIVGACIEHEHALLTAMRYLPVDDFRSEIAEDLRRVFYVLVGMYTRHSYDPKTNRDRLELCFPDLDIDGMWCPFGTSERYVEELVQAVSESNRLADCAVEAARAWQDRNPLMRAGEGSPSLRAPRREQHKRGGFVGGIDV